MFIALVFSKCEKLNTLSHNPSLQIQIRRAEEFCSSQRPSSLFPLPCLRRILDVSADHGFRLVVGSSSAMPDWDNGSLRRSHPEGIGGESVPVLLLVLVIIFLELDRRGEGVRHGDLLADERMLNSVVQFRLGSRLL